MVFLVSTRLLPRPVSGSTTGRRPVFQRLGLNARPDGRFSFLLVAPLARLWFPLGPPVWFGLLRCLRPSSFSLPFVSSLARGSTQFLLSIFPRGRCRGCSAFRRRSRLRQLRHARGSGLVLRVQSSNPTDSVPRATWMELGRDGLCPQEMGVGGRMAQRIPGRDGGSVRPFSSGRDRSGSHGNAGSKGKKLGFDRRSRWGSIESIERGGRPPFPRRPCKRPPADRGMHPTTSRSSVGARRGCP